MKMRSVADRIRSLEAWGDELTPSGRQRLATLRYAEERRLACSAQLDRLQRDRLAAVRAEHARAQAAMDAWRRRKAEEQKRKAEEQAAPIRDDSPGWDWIPAPPALSGW